MKTLITLFVCLCSLIYGQTNSCSNPLAFCAPTTTFNAVVNTSAGTGASYGCLTTQPSPTWLYTQIVTPGNISLQVSAANNVDIICWGPFTNTNFCSQLTATNIAGCSSSPSSTETITISGALTGQYYAFLVTNPTNTPQVVTLHQIAGSASACTNSLCGSLLTPGICFVTPNTNFHNQVYFNEDPSPVLKYSVIYREGVITGQWDSIGTVLAGQPGFFVDSAMNCNQQSYSYRIRNRDTCNNLTAYSPVHKTIHLQVNIGTSNGINLSWNNYIGVNYNTQYIYRGASPTSMTLYSQVASNINTYTDLAPLTGSSYYKIGINRPAGCNSSAPYSDTLIYSNMRQSTITSIEYLANDEFLSIYPNPASSSLYIRSFEASYTVEITDLLGKTVQERKVSENSSSFDVSLLNRGLYLVAITNSKGKYYKKILLE